MNLTRDGAERISKALSEDELQALDELVRRHGGIGAGIRIAHDEALSRILAAGGTMDRILKHGLETMPNLCGRSFSISSQDRIGRSAGIKTGPSR